VKRGQTKTCGSVWHRRFHYKPGHVFPKEPNLVYIRDLKMGRKPKTGKKKSRGLFLCTQDSCNTEVGHFIDAVKSGNSTTCGNAKHKRIKYEKGYVFPKSPNLTFIKIGRDYITPKSKFRKARAYFLCNLDSCNANKLKIIDQVKTGLVQSCGSPRHRYIMQFKVFDFIKITFKDAVSEYKLPNSKQRCDIFIPSIKTVIEVDGKQHDEVVWYDNGSDKRLKKQQNADLRKNCLINLLGYNIVRLKETEYRKNPEKALIDLLNQIQTKDI
jgi:hypothetical protein